MIESFPLAVLQTADILVVTEEIVPVLAFERCIDRQRLVARLSRLGMVRLQAEGAVARTDDERSDDRRAHTAD